jgi:hypothetical protein
MTLEDLREIIESDWSEKARLGAACLAVANYVCAGKDLRHLTFGKMRRIANQNSEVDLSERELVALAAYLCRDDLRVLRAGFEFVDENDQIFPVSKGDLNLAEKERAFPHPETGQLVENFKDHILIFFEPGERLEQR